MSDDLPIRHKPLTDDLTMVDLLHDRFKKLLTLEQIAKKYGYKSRGQASIAVRNALRYVDKQVRKDAPAMRARELLRLEQLDERLSECGLPSDPKVAAERRLLSESRRRMYALDLQREEAVQAPTFQIMFGTPGQRVALEAGEAEVVEGEIIPVAQIEGPTFSPDGDGPPGEGGPSEHLPTEGEA